MSYPSQRDLRRVALCLGWLSFLVLIGAREARAAYPGISKDASTAGSQGTGTSQTQSFTVPSGANHMLVVGATLQAAGTSASCTLSATYNSVAMTAKTQKDIASGYGKVQLFYLHLTGDGSAHNIVVSRASCSAGTYYLHVAAASFTNASSTTGAVQSGTNTSTTMATSSAPASSEGNIIVSQGIVTSSAANASVTTASPWTAVAYTNIPDAYNKVHFAYAPATDNASSTTVSFTVGGTSPEWGITAFAVKSINLSAVTVDNFAAFSFGPDVQLAWQTGSEIDNLGFNVYRDDGWGRVRLNRTPIIGSALLAGSGVSLAAGNRYQFTDLFDAVSGARPTYWLEDIDLNGQRTLHGPVQPRPGPVQLPPPGPPLSAATLATPEPIVEPPPSAPAVLDAGQTHPQQWRLASAGAVKIGVDRDGWYEVMGAELAAAGLDPASDPRRLGLFLDGEPVPLEVRGAEDGRLDPTDAIGFYGRRINAASTDTRVYWLAPVDAPARLGLAPAVTTVPTAGPDRFLGELEWRPRDVYAPAIINGDEENYFGPLVGADPVTHTLEVPEGVLPGPASLEVGLQGVSYVPHRVSVSVAGQAIGEVAIEQRERRSVVLPLAGLQPGPLELRLQAADATDGSLVDFVRLRYPRPLVASGGRLAFAAPAGSGVTVGGFEPGQAVAVLDVTEVPVSVAAEPASATGEVRFMVPAGTAPRRLLVRATGDHQAPRFVKADRPSRWSEVQPGGDLVVIGPAPLLPAIEPLARLRQSEGWTVATVDVEDAYDEFAFGSAHPAAIRALLARARSWQHPPRAVILLGDASNDPRDYRGRGRFDHIPTALVATHLIETASDDWFTDLDADGVADVPVGRLPARTLAEAEALVKKLLGAPVYRSAREAAAAAPLVFVAGTPDDRNDFPAASLEMSNGVSAPWRAVSIDRDLPGADRATQLRQALAGGPALLSYTGHGSQELWAGGLLSATSAAELSDTGPGTFLLDLTCLNGFFHDVLSPSLAEVLLARPQGGAFGVWASSALTEVESQTRLGQAFVQALVSEGLTAGEAAIRAKRLTADPDTRRSWILFGDPTWRLRAFPADAADASVPLDPDASAPPPMGDAGPNASTDAPAAPSADGCGCRVGGTSSGAPALLLLIAVLFVRRRRR